MTPPSSPWWSPQRHADRRPLLLARGRMRDAIRRHFLDEGFLEVDCGALQTSPGNETHLHAFATQQIGTDRRRHGLYLHTSPEFACKKLLAAGERKIFYFGPVYRNREQGALHTPEFTMLEWYRAEEPYTAVMEDCLRILRLTAETAGCTRYRFRNREADPHAPAHRVTVADAFREFASIDLLASVKADGTPDRDRLLTDATRAGIKSAADDSWSDLFSRILVERVEPELGSGAATILDAYPRAEAALARASAQDPRLAERFELYLCGVEIANGFGELTDPDEQRRRFQHDMHEKARIYDETYPIDEDFLAALKEMPDASGVALGFDRLVMLTTHAARIADVMWTPPPVGEK